MHIGDLKDREKKGASKTEFETNNLPKLAAVIAKSNRHVVRGFQIKIFKKRKTDKTD